MPASQLPIVPGLTTSAPTSNSSLRLTAGVSDGIQSDFSEKFENLLNAGDTLKTPFSLKALISEAFRGAGNGLAVNGKDLPNASFAGPKSETLSEYTLLAPDATAETLELANTPILLAPATALPLAVAPIAPDPGLSDSLVRGELLSSPGQKSVFDVSNARFPPGSSEITSGQPFSNYRVESDNVLLGDESRSISRLQDVQEQLGRITPENAIRNSGLENAANQIGRILERFSDVSGKNTAGITAASTVSPLIYAEGSSAQLTNTASPLRVEVPLGDDQWQRVFAERVIVSIDKGQSAQLRLTPAELGPIDISLNVDDDKIRLVFNTQQTAVKEQIEAALPKLREMLADQGLELGDVNVTHDDSTKHDRASQKNADQASSVIAGSEENDTEIEAIAINTQTISVSSSAVDYFV